MIDPPLPVHQCEFGNAPFWIESCDLVIFVNHFHKVVCIRIYYAMWCRMLN